MFFFTDVRYLTRFYAQEACHWWQEKSLEEEAKVSFRLSLGYTLLPVVFAVIISTISGDMCLSLSSYCTEHFPFTTEMG